MKRTLISLLILAGFCLTAAAQQPGIVIGKISPDSYKKSQARAMVTSNLVPEDMKQFHSLQNAIAGTPQGAAMVFFMAVEALRADEVMGRSMYLDSCHGTAVNRIDDVLGLLGDERFPFIYYKGSSKANNYTPSVPSRIEVTVSKESYDGEDGSIVLRLVTAGGEIRSITVRQVRGSFKVIDFDLSL